MISVDDEDFLIATDIDKLIEILSTKKDIEVGKLSKELKMNRREVEKWLRVLEEEGVVSLANRMGSLYAIWVMDTEPAPAAPQRAPQRQVAQQRDFELQMIANEEEAEEPARTQEKPLLGRFLKGQPKKQEPQRKEIPKITIDEEPKKARRVEAIPKLSLQHEPSIPLKKKLEKSEFLNLPPRQTEQLREKLDEYLYLIREGKEELKGLEGGKEKLHREGFLSLEKEFEASLDNLEYALLEKERRILEAKQRMATLPEKIQEIDQMQEALKQFDKEAGSVLSKTKKSLDHDWSNLGQVSEELSEELAKGEEDVMRDRSRMMQLRDMLQSIGHAESQLTETLASGRASIEEMEEKVRIVEESLEDLVDSRTILTERIEHIHSNLERRMKSLEDLRSELEKVEKIEEWFRSYADDYQGKMDELQEYVHQSDEELSRLKKAAEIEYVKKYLKELDRTEGRYRESLGALEMEEASIDEKISEVRSRIKQLMRESSELMSKYRQMADEGIEFQEVAATAREASARHRATIEEKASERKKMMEDAKKLHSSKSPRTPAARSKKSSKKKK